MTSLYLIKRYVLCLIVMLIQTLCVEVVFSADNSTELVIRNKSREQTFQFAPNWVINSVLNDASHSNTVENTNRYNAMEEIRLRKNIEAEKLADGNVKPDLQMRKSFDGISGPPSRKIIKVDDPNFISPEEADRIMQDAAAMGTITMPVIVGYGAGFGPLTYSAKYVVNAWNLDGRAYFNIIDMDGNLIGANAYEFTADNTSSKSYISDIFNVGGGKFAAIVTSYKYELNDDYYRYDATQYLTVYDTMTLSAQSTASAADGLVSTEGHSSYSYYNFKTGEYSYNNSRIKSAASLDIDKNGSITPSDMDYFIAAFREGVAGTPTAADVSGDGIVDEKDIDVFLDGLNKNSYVASDVSRNNFTGNEPIVKMTSNNFPSYAKYDAFDGRIINNDEILAFDKIYKDPPMAGTLNDEHNDSPLSSEDERISQAGKEKERPVDDKQPGRTKKSTTSPMFSDLLGGPTNEKEGLKNILTSLQNKKDRTNIEDNVLDIAKAILEEGERIDEDILKEFEEVVYIVIASESMKGAINKRDLAIIKQACSDLVKEQTQIYEDYLKLTDKAYEKLEKLLGVNIEKDLPEMYLSLASISIQAKRKILVDLALETLKAKERSALSDNEKEALDIDRNSLQALRETYLNRLRDLVKNFISTVRQTFKDRDPVAIENDKDSLKAVFLLDKDTVSPR